MKNHVSLLFFIWLLICSQSAYAANHYVKIDSRKPLNNQFVYNNALYYIDENIDLRGNTIVIPNNSTVLFNGGAISNGSVKGNNTIVQAAPYKIFDHVHLEGNWVANEAYAEWFGAIANSEKYDSREAIQKCLDVFNSVKLLGLYYLLSVGNDGICLQTHQGALIEGTQTPSPTDNRVGVVAKNMNAKIILALATASVVNNIGIKGSNSGRERENKIIGIYSNETSRIHLSDIQISNCGTAIDCVTYLTLCQRVNAFYCIKGFFFHGSSKSQYTSVSLDNCFVFSTLDYAYKFEKMIYSTLNTCAADFIGYDSSNKLLLERNSYEAAYSFEKCIGISLISCGSENCARGLFFDSCNNMDVRTSRFTAGYSNEVKDYLNDYIYIKNCFYTNINVSVELRNLPRDFKYINYSHYKAQTHNRINENMRMRVYVKSTGLVNSNVLSSDISYE